MALVPLDHGDLIDVHLQAGYRYRLWHYERGITPCLVVGWWEVEASQHLILQRIHNSPDHPERWCAPITIRHQVYFWFADPNLAFEFKMMFG